MENGLLEMLGTPTKEFLFEGERKFVRVAVAGSSAAPHSAIMDNLSTTGPVHCCQDCVKDPNQGVVNAAPASKGHSPEEARAAWWTCAPPHFGALTPL